jgi:hypothetical protein
MTTPNKYQKGKIYKIIPNDLTIDEPYIGSTTQLVTRRLKRHIGEYKRLKEGKVVKGTKVFTLFDKYGVDNCRVELIKYYPCLTKKELLTEEKLQIKLHPNAINEKSPIGRADHLVEKGTAHLRERYMCGCGVPSSIRHKARHERSVRHINWETYKDDVKEDS